MANNIKSYVVCRACGEKYESYLITCPSCNLKPNKDDYYFVCEKCYKMIESQDSEYLFCLNKKII